MGVLYLYLVSLATLLSPFLILLAPLGLGMIQAIGMALDLF